MMTRLALACVVVLACCWPRAWSSQTGPADPTAPAARALQGPAVASRTIIGPAQSQPDRAWAVGPASQPDYAFVHKATGFKFPRRIGPYTCFRVIHFVQDVNVGVDYKAEGGKMTLYVYPAPADARGPAFKLDKKGGKIVDGDSALGFELTEPSQSFRDHVDDCVQSAAKASGMKVLTDTGRVQARAEKDGPVGTETVMSTTVDDQEMRSKLLLFVVDGHFIKVRLTTPSENWEELGKSLVPFPDK